MAIGDALAVDIVGRNRGDWTIRHENDGISARQLSEMAPWIATFPAIGAVIIMTDSPFSKAKVK